MKSKKGLIVGCYTLDLYCAVDHNKLGQEFYNTDMGQFTGRTESSCLRKAKSKGWSVTTNRVLCPQHNTRKTP